MTNKDEERNSIISLLLIALGCLFLVGSFFYSWQRIEDNKNECQQLGGSYRVVDKEYSVALKHDVNIYGCVK